MKNILEQRPVSKGNVNLKPSFVFGVGNNPKPSRGNYQYLASANNANNNYNPLNAGEYSPQPPQCMRNIFIYSRPRSKPAT